MPECQLRFSRVLELPSKGAWCPARDADTEWIQVDLGADARVIIMMVISKYGVEIRCF
ncbi:unnamed protein product, partial [Ixodes pacificus]